MLSGTVGLKYSLNWSSRHSMYYVYLIVHHVLVWTKPNGPQNVFVKYFKLRLAFIPLNTTFCNAKQIFSQFGNLKIIFKNQCSFTTNKLSSLCSRDSNSYSSIPFTQDQALILSRKCVLNFMLFMPTDWLLKHSPLIRWI